LTGYLVRAHLVRSARFSDLLSAEVEWFYYKFSLLGITDIYLILMLYKLLVIQTQNLD